MNTYEIVTEKIMSLLEQGIVPWRRPWTSTGLPRNLMSKRPYRGINYFLRSASKYVSPFWLTLRQANELGGYIRKGEDSTIAVFWKVEDLDQNEDLGAKETEEKTRRRFLAPILSRLQPRTMRTAASRTRQASEDRDTPARPNRSSRADHRGNAQPA
jgi:antirestriction protein ArdC